MPIIPQVPMLQPEVGVPRYPRESAWTDIARSFGALGEIVAEQQQREDVIWLAEAKNEFVLKSDELKNQIAQEQPDPLKRVQIYPERQRQLINDIVKQAPSGKAATAGQVHLGGLGVESFLHYRGEQVKAKNDQENARLELLKTQYAAMAANEPDPDRRNAIKSEMFSLLQNAAGKSKTHDQAIKEVIAFDKSVDEARANDMIRTQGGAAFLTALGEGQFKGLGEDEWKFREAARTEILNDEKRNEQVSKDISEIVERQAAGLANQGKLTDDFLNDALAGNNPHLSPDKARTLKTINDNPPVGEGSNSVRAIMQEYHRGDSTFGRINAARAQLRALEATQTSPNALIDKAYNELQTDWRTMTGIGAAQTSRAVTDAKEDYDAHNPAPPFRIPGLAQKREQDKAKVGQAVRHGQDPKPIIERGKAENKVKTDAIPAPNKKVLDLVR